MEDRLFVNKEMEGDFKQVLLYVFWVLLKSTEVSSVGKKWHYPLEGTLWSYLNGGRGKTPGYVGLKQILYIHTHASKIVIKDFLHNLIFTLISSQFKPPAVDLSPRPKSGKLCCEY